MESVPHQPRPIPAATHIVGGEGEELDPELEALPGPPRRARTVTIALLALAAASALAMAVSMRREVAYAFALIRPCFSGIWGSPRPRFSPRTKTVWSRVDALLGAAGGIRYERPLHEDTFRAVPVVGRADLTGSGCGFRWGRRAVGGSLRAR